VRAPEIVVSFFILQFAVFVVIGEDIFAMVDGILPMVEFGILSVVHFEPGKISSDFDNFHSVEVRSHRMTSTTSDFRQDASVRNTFDGASDVGNDLIGVVHDSISLVVIL
jgi:hypothetical protein